LPAYSWSAERAALNFVQLLSAVATKTRAHVEAIAGCSPNRRGDRRPGNHRRHPRNRAGTARAKACVAD